MDYTTLFLDNMDIVENNLNVIKRKLTEAQNRNHTCNVTVIVYEYYNSYTWEHFDNLLNKLLLDAKVIAIKKRCKEYNLKLKGVK